jgi:aspartyl protease family protein
MEVQVKPLSYGCFLSVWFFVFVPIGAEADTVFKCKGADGNLHYQSTKCAQAEEVSSWGARSSSTVQVVEGDAGGAAFMVVRKNAFNAYWLRGSINGASVAMVVDTGASFVSIPLPLAKQLGLRCYSQVAMSTANGITQNCKSVVRSVQIGSMVLPDVEVVIMNNLNVVLLGQSALGRLKVEQSNGEIRLSTLQ